jgi:hypothetical protein
MVTVNVTVDDAHLDKIDDVAAELRRRGMHIDQLLGGVGVISGSAPDEAQERLSDVDGVEAVETTTSFQLPHRDSPVQ